MAGSNDPATTPAGSSPDPSQHVNYARGMVLGEDDFAQEFAYLAGRDEWVARDAIGYGTLSGLRVSVETDTADGPKLHVSGGTALLPSGKLVCVPANQCTAINQWLAQSDNAAIVNRLLAPVAPRKARTSVASGIVSLYLLLYYADAKTRPVPIAGEPGYSDDGLVAPSRVADAFHLDLRDRAPVQMEEDALRDFIRGLHSSVSIVDAPSPSQDNEATWLDALRTAAALATTNGTATGDNVFDFSRLDLRVVANQLPDFLRVAFRFWVTELRPLWMARHCHHVLLDDQDCVQLARVEMEVVRKGGASGRWQVAGSPAALTIDERTRPLLTNLRLAQESLLYGWCVKDAAHGVGVAGGGTAPAVPPVDGEVLIGSGGRYVPAHIHGSMNRVTVASGAGSITLSTPQDIALTSSPQFGGLVTTGGVRIAVSTVSTNTTLTAAHHVLLCTRNLTLTLPRVSAADIGRVYVVKNISNAAVRVVCASGNTVDGSSAQTVRAQTSITVVSGGTSAWHVIANVT